MDIKKDLKRGFIAGIPVGISVFVYGAVLGILTSSKGIGLGELIFSDFILFAGSAQFLLVDMWDGVILPVVLAVAVINLRYFLIGVSLKPLFKDKPFWQKILCMHLVADENWAVTMSALTKGEASNWFLLGSGICELVLWTGGTWLGYRGGLFISSPEALALDFVFSAVFSVIVIGFWQGKRSILPWLITILVSLLVWKLIPGKWYIVAGGLAGTAGTLLIPEEKREKAVNHG